MANQTGINSPVQITEPTDYQNLSDVLGPKTPASPIDTELNNIAQYAQSIFSGSNDYSSLCARGLLNGYNSVAGANLITSNNNIVKNGGKKPACFASATNYCISTQLADGTWECVGINASPGKTQCTSVATVCQ